MLGRSGWLLWSKFQSEQDVNSFAAHKRAGYLLVFCFPVAHVGLHSAACWVFWIARSQVTCMRMYLVSFALPRRSLSFVAVRCRYFLFLFYILLPHTDVIVCLHAISIVYMKSRFKQMIRKNIPSLSFCAFTWSRFSSDETTTHFAYSYTQMESDGLAWMLIEWAIWTQWSSHSIRLW